jgi:hypothetical protein
MMRKHSAIGYFLILYVDVPHPRIDRNILRWIDIPSALKHGIAIAHPLLNWSDRLCLAH